MSLEGWRLDRYSPYVIMLCIGASSGGVPYVYSQGSELTGTDWRSREVGRRKKPVGFKMPTGYQRHSLEGDVFGYPNVFAYYYNPAYDAWATLQGGATHPWTDVSSQLSVPSDVRSRAILQARLNLKDQKVNLSTAFVERRQVVSLVTDTAHRLGSAINDLKHGRLPKSLGKLKSVSKTLKTAGQQWLELQYGWKPLLSDVKGAAEALVDADMKDTARYGASVHGRASDVTKYVDDRDGFILNGGCPCHYLCQVDTRYSCKVNLNFLMDSAPLVQAAALGLTNPLELAWEEIPFSFVADWFVPIGNYLSALDAEAGWTFRAGSIGEVVDSKSRMHLSENHDPYWNQGLQNIRVSGHASSRRRFYDRTTLGAAPVPELPSALKALSTLHMSQALALLTGRLKGLDSSRRYRYG
jgi:hypothetical protein